MAEIYCVDTEHCSKFLPVENMGNIFYIAANDSRHPGRHGAPQSVEYVSLRGEMAAGPTNRIGKQGKCVGCAQCVSKHTLSSGAKYPSDILAH